MSWRFLIATLLIALGASAWGGIQLGDWLVAHAPAAAPAPGQDAAASQQPVLDANGRPYVAQPPQPRIDGTLGVPDKPADREWQVNTVSLFDTVSDPAVQISRERISPEQARNRCLVARAAALGHVGRQHHGPAGSGHVDRHQWRRGRRRQLRHAANGAGAPAAAQHGAGTRRPGLAGCAAARTGPMRHARLLRASLVFLERAQQVLRAEPRLGHDGRMPGPSAVRSLQRHISLPVQLSSIKNGAPRGAISFAAKCLIRARTSGFAGSSGCRPCRSGRSGFPGSRCALRCRPGCPGRDRATRSPAPIRNTQWLP